MGKIIFSNLVAHQTEPLLYRRCNLTSHATTMASCACIATGPRNLQKNSTTSIGLGTTSSTHTVVVVEQQTAVVLVENSSTCGTQNYYIYDVCTSFMD